MFNFVPGFNKDKVLIWSLVKNDFRERYLGNVLGVTWAFIQPAVTILILWFVFQVGFKSKPVNDFPFILWLVAGMFPWFFIAESIASGANSIIANAFLVKKIVFRVNLLPIISILTALFIHLFFIIVMMCMFIAYGFYPSIHWLQILYYLLCGYILVLGLGWLTSSIVVFFKDVGQLVSVIIQLGFWVTPIFWSINIIPEKYHWLIKLNPLTYIVEGYRSSMIYHTWFWENISGAVYFWTVTIALLFIGRATFKKLKPHFADVL